MKWRNEIPKTTGWYFYRRPKGLPGRPQERDVVVYVRRQNSGDGMRVDFPHTTSGRHFRYARGLDSRCLWAGPLVAPKLCAR